MISPYVKTRIGTWHETSREMRFCPSYYAADYQTIETTTGDYEAYLQWDVTGFRHPMPERLSVSLAARTTGGELFSGIGGVNYASTPIERGPYTYTIDPYVYQSAKLVADGMLTLAPEWEWLTLAKYGYIKHAGIHWTKDMVRSLAL